MYFERHYTRTIRGNTPERLWSRRNSRKMVLVAEDQGAVASDHAEVDPNRCRERREN